MAITRSKNSVKKQNKESSKLVNNDLKSKNEIIHKSSKAKSFSINHVKNSKISKFKNGNNKISSISESSNKSVSNNKIIKDNINSNEINNNNNYNNNNNNSNGNNLNSEIFKAANVEVKGRKLPPYKVEQLQRLQDLISMSSIAKPRGPITFDDYNNINNSNQQNETSLKVIDKINKEKVSNITNYDPIRIKFLNQDLNDNELTELEEKYKKIRDYKNIIAPKLSDDIDLQDVLTEIVENDYGLKFFNYFKNKPEINFFGNPKLFENERDLQLLGFSNQEREKILKKIKFEFEKNGKNEENEENDYATNVSNIKSFSGNFKKINIEEMKSNTDLGTMLKEVMINNSFLLENEENEESAFKGLKTSDFTTIKKFDNKEI